MIDFEDNSAPLYLHFLNREFARAVDAPFTTERSARFVLGASMLTDSTLLSSLALVWESGLLDSEYSEAITHLLMTGQLMLISDFATLDRFLAACRTMYRHDTSRYPMYFREPAQGYDLARPAVVKTASTTLQLERNIAGFVDGQFDVVSGMPNTDISRIIDLRPALDVGISMRAGRALTQSLFNTVLEPSQADLVIGRLLAVLHVRHYLDFTGGDIVTGLPGLEYLDVTARAYPRFDAWYATRLMSGIGLPEAVRMHRWRSVLAERGSPEHRVFVAYLRRLMCGLEYAVREVRTPPGGLRAARAARMNRLFAKIDPPRQPITGPAVYGTAAARLAHVAVVAERTDPLFRSYVEQEKAGMTSSPRRALILVATDRERDAVIRAVERADSRMRPKRDFLPHHTGFHLGVLGDVEVILVQSEMGTESPGSMTLTAADVVGVYRPDYLILCGIAFGLREREQAIGDILVSTQLRLWDPKKVTGSRGEPATVLRGDKVSASVKLVDRFRSATTDWTGAQVRHGLVLSANTLVNASGLRKWLVAAEPDALGGEMEGAGVYCVGAKYKIDWIVVKAIADWGMRKTDGSQQLAADNAASYVVHVLRTGGLAATASI